MRIRWSDRIAVALVAAFIATPVLLLCNVGLAAAAATKPASHTVVIEGTRFDPATLDIRAGDTIVWVNKDPFPHTATSKMGGFDSHEIAAGASWKYTAKRKGVFPYVCTFHPTMKATLKVSAGDP